MSLLLFLWAKSFNTHPIYMEYMDFMTSFCYNGFRNQIGVGGPSVEEYNASYLLVAIFIALGIFLPVAALTLGRLLRPKKPEEMKYTTYESGVDPVGSGNIRFNIRYYIFALMFVLFDVEIVFLYPWAVAYGQLGLFALIEMLIFIVLFLVGLIYAWKKKVLKWTTF